MAGIQDRRAIPASERLRALAQPSEANLRLLLASVADHAIFMLDCDGFVASWNAGAERMKGYREEEILGCHFSVFYPEDFLRDHDPTDFLDRAAKQGHFEGEGWRVRKDGSTFWANAVLSPMRDAAGELVGFAKVTRDLTERRRAELQIEEERARLSAILDCVAESVAVCNLEGNLIHLNRAALRMTGARPGEELGTAFGRGHYYLADGVTPVTRDNSVMLRALRGETTEDIPLLIRSEGAPDLRVSMSARPLIDTAGSVKGAVAVVRDVTRATQMADELQRQRELLLSVLDCVAESIAVFGREGRLVLCNAVFTQRLAGPVTPPELYGQSSLPLRIFTPDGSRPLSRAEWPAERALRGELVEDMEILVRPTGGEGLLVSTNARLMRGQRGEMTGVVVTGRDVTARHRFEQSLLEQKNLLAAILDCLGEAVIVYDRSGRILMKNPAAARHADPTQRDDTTYEERAAAYRLRDASGEVLLEDSPLRRALRGDVMDDAELLIRGGSYPEGLHISANTRLLKAESGETLGAVLTYRDITQRKRAEKERDDLLKEVRRSNEELAQFAYAASHDLRAPLRAVDKLSAWIEEGLAPHFTDETRDYMRLLRRRVARMDALLHDLLEFSRIGRFPAEVNLIEPTSLLGEVIELASPPSSFRIVLEVRADAFYGSAVSLKRALLNLVGNAVKHHDRKDGTIIVTARNARDTVEFEVKDDGPGIPLAFQEKIFQMFQTLKSRDEIEGSGMGLAFVKRLAELAGGTIEVASEGRGTSFVLRWPRQ